MKLRSLTRLPHASWPPPAGAPAMTGSAEQIRRSTSSMARANCMARTLTLTLLPERLPRHQTKGCVTRLRNLPQRSATALRRLAEARAFGPSWSRCLPTLSSLLLVWCLINSWTIADGACEARSRSDEEAMLIHRRRIVTTRSPATPIGPSGCGGTAASSSSLLGHNEGALLPRRS